MCWPVAAALGALWRDQRQKDGFTGPSLSSRSMCVCVCVEETCWHPTDWSLIRELERSATSQVIVFQRGTDTGHKYRYIEYAFAYQEHTLTNAQLSFSQPDPLSIPHTHSERRVRATVRGRCLEGPPGTESPPCGSWLIPSQVNTTMTSPALPGLILSALSLAKVDFSWFHSSNKTQRRSSERQGQSDSGKVGHLPRPLSLIAVILGVSSIWCFGAKGLECICSTLECFYSSWGV